ncbi:MAG: ABC transporter ATP-binding protein [Actinomycetota bacterium]|nr:ABC transporter ATP-binding protein [Actinomycetota bacterium]
MTFSPSLMPKKGELHGTPTIISVSGASRTYPTRSGADVVALTDVDLTVRRGNVVSLVGPSGCGKSTLLKMIAGLVEPTTGAVTINDKPASAGRADCGIMLQSPVLLPWRSTLENILLPVEVLRLDRSSARARAMDLIDMVGLRGFEHKQPWELSGGMQQRASLARLLIFEPDVLLMDEPFAALDEFTRERLDQEVASLQTRLNRTIVYVTHNIGEAVALSDEVVVMTPRPGRIVDRVPIELPKPRTPEVMDSPEAVSLVAGIRKILANSLSEAQP